MRSNRVTTTEVMHVKWINKYLLFRPQISVGYNYIAVLLLKVATFESVQNFLTFS